MYRQWLGLEHLGLHPGPNLNAHWSGKSQINGVGPFTLSRSTQISNAIQVESPAWFEITSVTADGRSCTVQGDLVNEPVSSGTTP